MFNIGSQEVLIILLLVFLLFGPRHIPEVAHALGKGLGDVRRVLHGVEENVRRAGMDLQQTGRIDPQGPDPYGRPSPPPREGPPVPAPRSLPAGSGADAETAARPSGEPSVEEPGGGTEEGAGGREARRDQEAGRP